MTVFNETTLEAIALVLDKCPPHTWAVLNILLLAFYVCCREIIWPWCTGRYCRRLTSLEYVLLILIGAFTDQTTSALFVLIFRDIYGHYFQEVEY